MSVARYFNQRLRKRILAGEKIPWLEKHPRKSYIVAACLSAVPWGDKNKINELRKRAQHLTQTTGVLHVLDHINPITHPYVCGLTVWNNLQVMPHWANAYKSNRWSPDQEEMFKEPEQFSLIPEERISA